ncbi:hypothetical protein AB0H76_37720 [Nocardia sp. NPDC050712]|uniref:hypothetical protein n=1 Tax=Nocardia sp. NPDC050712 TaxID=3155518 RepID=UPI0033F2D5B0
MAMEWVAIVGTLGGAVVGAGTTLLTDLVRARRDKAVRTGDTQRQIYVKYLAAVVQTDNAMQALAIGQATPLGREDVTGAFRSQNLVAALLELELVAPEAVCGTAQAAYQKLRNIRETLATTSLTVGGPNGGSQEWHAVHEPFRQALHALKVAMRQELGGPMLPRRPGEQPALGSE